MMRRVVILGVVVASLFLAGVAVAVQGGSDADTAYRVEGCAVSGGAYRLVSLGWEIEGASGGGGYRLAVPEAPGVSGSGCCCTYLPMMFRSSRP